MSELAKLRWQCRRGTLELDFLLMRYLDNQYTSATSAEQVLFKELLAFEDDVLIDLLLVGSVCLPQYAAIVQTMRLS